jgi:type I restriction enzyme S subunit
MSWQIETLENLLAPTSNVRAGEQDIPVLSITMQGGLVDQSAKFKKRIASQDISNYRVVYANELVVGFPIDEGVLGFQTKYPAAVVSPAYSIWKLTRPSDTHIPFIERYLRSSEARKMYAKKMRGAVARRRSLSKEDFLKIEIPFPPLDEQKRIAAILESTDMLRRIRQESLALSDKLLQSVFLDMFGDPVTNPKGWRQAPLTEVCQPISGGTPSKSNAAFWDGGTLPWFTPKDLKSDELSDSIDHVSELVPDQTNLQVFPADTVLIVVRGMILAHSFPVSVIKTAGVINQDIKALVPQEDIQPDFLAACLRAQRAYALTKVSTAGHGTKKLDSDALSQLKIVIPPTDLQARFILVVSGQRTILQEQRESLKQLNILFSSLQQRAFQGELDLSRFVPDHTPLPTTAYEQEQLPPQGRETTPSITIFQTPDALIATLKELDAKVNKGEQIPWSGDYFKYRILGVQPIPFSFAEVMEKAESIFEELPYEEIKDIIMDLLGKGAAPALLIQTFDLNIDAATKETSGRKEIVFRPVE